MYQESNKENYNYSPSPQRKHDVGKGESKSLGYNYEKAETKRGFSRLLKDATNTIRSDLDHQVAEKVQDDDATDVINGWMLEQRDSRLAARVAKDMEAEFKSLRHSEISQGEAAAMMIALEERMKLLKYQETRLENEEKDYAMAKKEHDEEESIISRCLKDDSYAKELQDYEYAERVRNDENREALIKEKNDAIDLAADEKVAEEHQMIVDREYRGLTVKQEEKDCKFAQCIADEDINNNKMNKISKQKQENDDKIMSKKMQSLSIRAEHRKTKYVEMMNKCEDICIDDLWEFAEPSVEDVPNGICVSLLLPNIITISVKLTGKSCITLKASRLIHENEKKTATSLNSAIDIDFDIEGIVFALTNDDLSYEYDSQESMLYVYIEKVHLETLDDIQNDKSSKNMKTNNTVPKLLNGLSLQLLKTKISRRIFGTKN